MTAGIEPSRLKWSDTISEALSSITQRPVRTLLTALGTILGVGAFVATNGLAETARAQVSSRFDALKATEVRIQDAAPDDTNPFPGDVGARLERLNGINHAGLYFTIPDNGTLQPRTTPTRSTNPSTTAPVIAAQPGALLAALPTLQVGRLYDQFFEDESVRVAVLGRAAASQLGIARIDNQPAVFIGDNAYTIIGIIDDVERNPDLLLAVIIPTSTATRDLGVAGATYQVLIDTQPGAAALAGRQAPVALRPDLPERLQALVPPDPKRLRNQVSGDITSLFLSLSALALLIGTVAIANATLLNVIERRSEIGLRRALGAKRAHISRQITVEAALVGAGAGAVGASLGIIGIVITSAARGWTATIDPTMVLIAPAIGLATGALAGLVPAIRASHTPPAETLRG
ncbi:MAG TPA: ABC transporter permease [Ilumatobacteraceae bacterium]|nr:ABC transporter permease [Ilumatobacteraceae bacterium]